MKPNSLLILAGLLAAAPVFAAGTLPSKANAKAAAHAALGSDDQDGPEATPPTLPSQASDRARTVQSTIAFGKKGAEERAAHSRAGKHAQDAANEAADRSAQGAAASAAKSANADSHAAAGLTRAASARGGAVPGAGAPARGR